MHAEYIHILSLVVYTFRENREFVFIVLCCLWWVQIVGYVFGLQIVFVCLYITPSHYHHCANCIWRHWTFKMSVTYNLSSVGKIKHILSVIHYTICGAVCFQLTHFLRDDWENIILCLIIIISSEVWTITHCLGLCHETMVCTVCLSIFLFLLLKYDDISVVTQEYHKSPTRRHMVLERQSL